MVFINRFGLGGRVAVRSRLLVFYMSQGHAAEKTTTLQTKP